MAKLSRKELLIKLEEIIGSSCYNGNIQNWGANGEWLGEGRSFRYPIRVHGLSTRGRIKTDVSDHDLKSAYYAFGANQLHIIRALEEVLDFIEYEYGVDIPKVKHNTVQTDLKQKTECAYCGKFVVDVTQHVSQNHSELWEEYVSLNDISAYLKGKTRCSGCGSFLKSLENHNEKCPKKLERN
ncbi:hypothetical protein ACLHZ7_12425 [Aeromonas salmonicida]|uniref:hypothetical protein n=1 Tax=Aeromonas salmonicida TaxID=645 RepID=UPI003D010774